MVETNQDGVCPILPYQSMAFLSQTTTMNVQRHRHQQCIVHEPCTDAGALEEPMIPSSWPNQGRGFKRNGTLHLAFGPFSLSPPQRRPRRSRLPDAVRRTRRPLAPSELDPACRPRHRRHRRPHCLNRPNIDREHRCMSFLRVHLNHSNDFQGWNCTRYRFWSPHRRVLRVQEERPAQFAEGACCWRGCCLSQVGT